MTNNRRILIIDDDRDIWRPYRDVLAAPTGNGGAGDQLTRLLATDSEPGADSRPIFELQFAAQGEEGFKLVEQALEKSAPFAVAFIDIRMPPGWDGMKTAAKIRRLDPRIEIVIVTAFSDHAREEIVRVVSAPDKLLFLRKPFDAEELTQIALSLTEKWKLARQEEAQRLELQMVLQTTPAAIFTLDDTRRISTWNPAAERITGYSAAEVVGKPCLIPKIAADNKCQNCFLAKGGEQTEADREVVITDKSGRQRVIYKSISLVRDSSNHVLKAVESFWDITAMKQAEAALLESEARFRALVETSSDWVWEVDESGRFTYCSPVCFEIYGYQPSDLLGQYIYDVIQPADDPGEFRRFFLDRLRRGVPFQAVIRRCARKDGSEVHIESSGVPVLGADGVKGFRGIDRDITERRKGEEERARLEEQYRQSQKMDSLGTLAGGIAHDLNNMLTPIIGNAQLALMMVDQTSEVRGNLQDIEKCAERAAALIRQILAFSRKQLLMPKVIDLNSLIEDFVKMLRRLIREDIELKLELAPQLARIYVDAGQVEQVLMNLVVNARDAMPKGGEILISTTNATLESGVVHDVDGRPISGDFVVLIVRDNGQGMDQATFSRLFDPFFTTKDVGKGTGMGLSTVYGIINQHKGHIRFETGVGRGTSFFIYLPISSAPPAPELEKESEVSVRGGDEVILLAEDEPGVRSVTVSILQRLGYQVLEAGSGVEAMQLFEKTGGAIDLLLTDIVMPGLGGEALARRLMTSRPGLAVICMSGYLFDLSVNDFAPGKRFNFLQKPFTPTELGLKVREVLDQASPAA